MACLTLRNVPDQLVARLKERARRNRRSLNSETIACLEHEVAPEDDLEARLARIEALRSSFQGPPIPDEELVAAVERHNH